MICQHCNREDVILWDDGELRCNYCFNHLEASFKTSLKEAKEHHQGICPFCGEYNQPFRLDWENDRLVCGKCGQSFRPQGLVLGYREVYNEQQASETFVRLFFDDDWWQPLDIHRTTKKQTILIWILWHLDELHESKEILERLASHEQYWVKDSRQGTTLWTTEMTEQLMDRLGDGKVPREIRVNLLFMMTRHSLLNGVQWLLETDSKSFELSPDEFSSLILESNNEMKRSVARWLERNYKKVPSDSRRELLRHLMPWMCGFLDEDVACEFLKEVNEFDDKWWEDEDSFSIAIWLEIAFSSLPRKLRESLLIKLARNCRHGDVVLELILRNHSNISHNVIQDVISNLSKRTPFSIRESRLELLSALALDLPPDIRSSVFPLLRRIFPEPEPELEFIGNSGTVPPPRNSPLREWWHEVVRRYDHYPSYAMLLALPADEEVIRYQREFGKELHLITGENCLVITLTGLGFMQYGSDDMMMPSAIDESVSNGYCLKIADLFNIQFDQFPCLILFRDIRSPDHILITLKGLSKEEVAQEMRELFSVIKQAVKEGKEPLKAVESHNRRKKIADETRATWSSIQIFVGKTLEKAMQALIETSVK